MIGAETIFAPYRDGEIPNDEAVRRYVADVIRTVKPTYIITHWSHSIHKDRAYTSLIVQDAVLLASLEGVVTPHPAHKGIRGIYYADNWEDAEAFSPYTYVGVADEIAQWREAVTKYGIRRRADLFVQVSRLLRRSLYGAGSHIGQGQGGRVRHRSVRKTPSARLAALNWAGPQSIFLAMPFLELLFFAQIAATSPPSAAIRINQLGYLPDAPKVAVFCSLAPIELHDFVVTGTLAATAFSNARRCS